VSKDDAGVVLYNLLGTVPVMQVPMKNALHPDRVQAILGNSSIVEQAEAPAYSSGVMSGGRFRLKALAKRPDKMPLTALIPAPAESKAVS